MTTAEQNYIFSLEEPDLILYGNGKRYQPMTPSWITKRELMEKFGDKFEENMRYDSLTIAEKDKMNEEHLKRMGL